VFDLETFNMHRIFATIALLVAFATQAAPPNIVYILADDLGYGDLNCYNPDGKIPTPNLDRLAAEGARFTDVHSGSAVCTPTRYGILTGRYSWRSKMQRGVLHGPSPPLITPDRATVAGFLKEHGYATACVGKWHLGLDWTLADGKIDYAVPLKAGPNALGFDYFFGIPASLDMPPYVFVENALAVEAATATIEGREKPLYWRGGPIAPGFKHQDVHPTFTRKAVEVIEKHAARGDAKPLFLYLPLASPHTPILPSDAARGRSGIGDYGDFVCDVDDTVGAVIAALEKAGLRENTLVLFTSDNGFAPAAGKDAIRAKGHEPCPGLRGHKADIFEGGHRVPFIANWPGHVPAGSVRKDTAWLGDLFATAAAIVGVPLPQSAGVDSESLLLALLGKDHARDPIVSHSADGYFAIRDGDWKLIFASHSGGWSAPKADEATKLGLLPLQLYDLAHDLAEQHNVVADHPKIVARLTTRMEAYIANGRSNPGPKQPNDAEITLLKKP